MSDDTTIYISVESSSGRLVIDGSMILWRDLLGSLAREATEPGTVERKGAVTDRQLAEPVR